jgi:hypothetical protein
MEYSFLKYRNNINSLRSLKIQGRRDWLKRRGRFSSLRFSLLLTIWIFDIASIKRYIRTLTDKGGAVKTGPAGVSMGAIGWLFNSWICEEV